jgi:ABC-2 type transport system ATP-binding protein
VDPETDDREPETAEAARSGAEASEADGESTPTGASATEEATEKAPEKAPEKPAEKAPAARKPAATKRTTPTAKPAVVASSAATKKAAAPRKTAAPRKPAAPNKPAPKPTATKPTAAKSTTAKSTTARSTATKTGGEAPEKRAPRETVLQITGLSKHFDQTFAVDSVSLSVQAGTIFGIVGPNGAGKTTTLSMVTGLLRPDAGTVRVHGADVWTDPEKAKRNMGVLPDRLRLFDRLTGGQLLYYSGILRGLSAGTVTSRSADLAVAFGLEDALDRLVADYSAGMTKKVALAAAMIHSPRLLILDEPFESVDPVSAANVIEILQKYTAAGGTVVLSSHSMDLIQRICDSVAIIIEGRVLASGTVRQVRGTQSLEQRFVELAGGRRSAEGMEWLHSFSD